MSASPAVHRAIWVDVFRGLAILLVVFGHTARGLDHAGMWPGYEGGLIDHWIYAFHMPAFFFAAGLFANQSLAKGAGRYVGAKCRTVVYPYVLWSVIHLSSMTVMGRQANTAIDSSAFARLHYQPVGNYWFLYVLFLWQLLYLVTLWRPLGQCIFAGLGIFAWAIASTRPFDRIAAPGTLWVWNDFLKYGIYFCYGDLVARIGLTKSGNALRSLTLALLSFGGLSWLTVAGKSYQQAWWDLPLAMLGIHGLWYLAVAIDAVGTSKSLASLGRYSLEIYLAHNLFCVAARVGLAYVGLRSLGVQLPVGLAAGIIGPLILAFLSERYRFRWLFRL